jgi:hypothetical protein
MVHVKIPSFLGVAGYNDLVSDNSLRLRAAVTKIATTYAKGDPDAIIAARNIGMNLVAATSLDEEWGKKIADKALAVVSEATNTADKESKKANLRKTVEAALKAFGMNDEQIKANGRSITWLASEPVTELEYRIKQATGARNSGYFGK